MNTAPPSGPWREVERRPIPGNSPDDRILRGPDCHRPKRVCADPLPATAEASETTKGFGMRFRRHGGIYRSDAAQHKPLGRTAASRWSAPSQGKERDGRSALCSSSTMSSDRLFLDRVARQHCPSPLHRHAHTTMCSSQPPSKPDISTLQRIGHFYFALTRGSIPYSPPGYLATHSHTSTGAVPS